MLRNLEVIQAAPYLSTERQQLVIWKRVAVADAKDVGNNSD
jgi:hypothetical protein